MTVPIVVLRAEPDDGHVVWFARIDPAEGGRPVPVPDWGDVHRGVRRLVRERAHGSWWEGGQ